MAQEQRVRTPRAPKAENSGGAAEKFIMVLEASDDEAPEEVTFEDSRVRALRSVKEALETARREKELLKEKRRKRQELFQEQKKRKLLPAEVLEEIEPPSSKKQKQSEVAAAAEEAAAQDGQQEGKRTNKRKKKQAAVRRLRGNVTVTTVKACAVSSFQQQAAEDFVRSRLYGPGSCRTTSTELLSLHNKTGQNQSAAVQFVKKNWAEKQKAKAEKLKKRWVHKQQIPS